MLSDIGLRRMIDSFRALRRSSRSWCRRLRGRSGAYPLVLFLRCLHPKIVARPCRARNSLRGGDGAGVGGKFTGFDDEEDGAGVGPKRIGFVRLEHSTHATGELIRGPWVLFD